MANWCDVRIKVYVSIVFLVYFEVCFGKTVFPRNIQNLDSKAWARSRRIDARKLIQFRQEEESEEETPVATANPNGAVGQNGTVQVPTPSPDAFTMFFTQVLPAVQGLIKQVQGDSKSNPVDSAVKQFQDLAVGPNINIDFDFGIDLDNIIKMASKILPPPLDTQVIGVYKILQSNLPRPTTRRSHYVNNLYPSRISSTRRVPVYIPPPPTSTTIRYYPDVQDGDVGSFLTIKPEPIVIASTTQKPETNVVEVELKHTPKPIDIGNFVELHQLINQLGAFTQKPNFETFTEKTQNHDLDRVTEHEIEQTVALELEPTTQSSPNPTSTKRYRIRTTTPKPFLVEEDEEEPEIQIPTEQIKISFTLPTHSERPKSTPRYTPEDEDIKIPPAKLQSILSKYQYNRRKPTTGSPLYESTILPLEFQPSGGSGQHHEHTNTDTQTAFNTIETVENDSYETPRVRTTSPSTKFTNNKSNSWNSQYLLNSEPISNMNPWKAEATTTTFRTTPFDPYQAKYQYNLPKRTIASFVETSTPISIDIESLLSSGSIVTESWRRRKPPRRTIPLKI